MTLSSDPRSNTSKTRALNGELGTEAVHPIEEVAHLGDVVLAAEEWAEPLQVDPYAHAESAVGFGDPASGDEPPGAHAKECLRFSLRLAARQRHGVHDRFLPASQRRLQDTGATKV